MVKAKQRKENLMEEAVVANIRKAKEQKKEQKFTLSICIIEVIVIGMADVRLRNWSKIFVIRSGSLCAPNMVVFASEAAHCYRILSSFLLLSLLLTSITFHPLWEFP